MMAETPEVAPFRKDCQCDDGADAWDATQNLIISTVNEQVISHALDLIPLADQASGFGNDHPEHVDGRRVSWQRQPDGCSRCLVDIRQQPFLAHLATNDVPGGFDERLL
jgi:hypothetical protein